VRVARDSVSGFSATEKGKIFLRRKIYYFGVYARKSVARREIINTQETTRYKFNTILITSHPHSNIMRTSSEERQINAGRKDL
jgi:hypothetical protein